MAVVVDTNIVSLIFKQDSRSLLYKPHLDNQFMILSFMTLAELRRWALASNWGQKKNADFNIHLRRYSIQHSTPDLCRIWAEIKDNGRRTGKNIDMADAWIAATALYFNIPLVTHNRTDFQSINGLQVISDQ